MRLSGFVRGGIDGDESVVIVESDVWCVLVKGVVELKMATYRYKPIETKI
jgi:hypothetical protein